MKISQSFVSTAVLLAIFPAAAAVPSYSFTSLGAGSSAEGVNEVGQVVGYRRLPADNYTPHAFLWNGGQETALWDGYASGINNLGQIVGNGPNDRALLWSGGTTTTIGQFFTSGINDLGQVVGAGYAVKPGQSFVAAVMWDGGTITPLDAPPQSYAMAINNAGQISGASNVPWMQSTRWDGTKPTELQRLGVYESFGKDINESGVVVGYGQWLLADGTKEYHAALWDGFAATNLGGDAAYGINNFGQVVGGGADIHAVIWQGGVMSDLNSFLDASTVAAGWVLNNAKDISDNGYIIGYASNTITGEGGAFVMTPLPEPEIYAMLAIGLGILSWRMRRNELVIYLVWLLPGPIKGY